MGACSAILLIRCRLLSRRKKARISMSSRFSDVTSLSLLLESLAKEKHLHTPPCSIKTLGDYMNVMINLCSDNPKT